MKSPIEQAIDKAGSGVILASQLDVTPQYISKALGQGWLSIEKAQIVHDLYGIALVELLHPDVAKLMRAAASSN
jgi:hypothetical protein